MSGRKPWEKWYPQRWLSETRLRLCSREARSFWLDCLCLMMQENSYRLEVEGRPATVDDLSRILGDDPRTVRRLLKELRERGVYDVDGGGFIFSRKRRDDAEKEARDQANGKKGGNPSLRSLAEDPAELRPEVGPKLDMESGGRSNAKASEVIDLPAPWVNPCLNARSQSPDPRDKEDDDVVGAQAREAFFTRILVAAGLNPKGILSKWWMPPAGELEVNRWPERFGLTEDQCVGLVTQHRARSGAPPNGPRAFDHALEHYARTLAASPPPITHDPTATGGSRHGRQPDSLDRTQRVIAGAAARARAREARMAGWQDQDPARPLLPAGPVDPGGGGGSG